MQERDSVFVGLSGTLEEAGRPLRVLSTISWGSEVKEKFFAAGAKELPVVNYPAVDTASAREAIAQVRSVLDPQDPDHALIRATADSLDVTAQMLAAVGTPAFSQHSIALYGAPKIQGAYEDATPLFIAEHFDEHIRGLTRGDLGAPPPACHLATALAADIRTEVARRFGADAPSVEVVPTLSANALAGSKRIRLRADACFTDQDLAQLVEHEAQIHVATSLNGHAQTECPLLKVAHPRTTSCQEGLAVMAEFVTGAMDPDRLLRLADRVFAIQMALDGGDFLDVYRFFLERGISESQAYENARRVFRGGTVDGGAAFTKDVVYLGGLLRVHNFMRAALMAKRADCIRMLFVGKLDLEMIPALCRLAERGLVQPAKFLPPWVSDLRFLVCALAYASSMSLTPTPNVLSRMQTLLEDAPQLSRSGDASDFGHWGEADGD